MKRAACWFPPVVNGLTFVSALALWLYIWNDSFYYYAGSTFRGAIGSVFVICLFAQFARAIMPVLSRAPRLGQRAMVGGILVVLFGVIIHLEQEQFFRRELGRFRADRIAYSGESDFTVLKAFTDRNFYYPPESFLEEARRLIPESDAVLYIGDIRPDPVNYALYPRPVYALPELQRATLASAVYAWGREPDPAFPDGFASWLKQADVDAAAIGKDTATLIRERDIRWVVVVDALDASANRIVRVGGGE